MIGEGLDNKDAPGRVQDGVSSGQASRQGRNTRCGRGGPDLLVYNTGYVKAENSWMFRRSRAQIDEDGRFRSKKNGKERPEDHASRSKVHRLQGVTCHRPDATAPFNQQLPTDGACFQDLDSVNGRSEAFGLRHYRGKFRPLEIRR